MVDEIRGKYYSFVKEKNLSGRNYKVEYRFRFVPKDLWSCFSNIKYTKDVVECDFTDDIKKKGLKMPLLKRSRIIFTLGKLDSSPILLDAWIEKFFFYKKILYNKYEIFFVTFA